MSKTYAFEGHVIRLNQSDYQAWLDMMLDANMTEQQLLEELQGIDNWLMRQPISKRKNWYFLTSAILRRKIK